MLSLAAVMPAAARAAARRPLGLADITVARELARDYAGTVRAVAAMGYTHFGFRLVGYGPSSGELAPMVKARLVRDAGMTVGVVRLGVRGGDYQAQLDQVVQIGAQSVALTAAPPFIGSGRLGQATRASFEAWLPRLAELCDMCRAAGQTLAYHNHPWDLMPLEGGEAPLDTLTKRFSPDLLSFEVDLAWAWYAGVAPLDLIGRLGARVTSMHLKDIDRARGSSMTDHATVVGSGEMGYATLLPQLFALTSAVGYVEVDAPDDGLAAAAKGIAFVREHAHSPARRAAPVR